MGKIKFFLVFSVISLHGWVFAQSAKDTLIARVVAQYPMQENMTMQECKRKVLDKAKEEAIRKAGILENLTSNSTLLQSESKSKFIDLFSKLTQIDLSGAVLRCDNVVFSTFDDPSLNITQIKVVADITVRRYSSKKDPAFTLVVKGLKSVYSNGDDLDFTVKPQSQGYLTIFLIGDNSSILFPIPNFHCNLDSIPKLLRGVEYSAPFTDKLNNYKIEASYDGETEQLLFVFTKKQIVFSFNKTDEFGNLTKANQDQIIEWINRIEPSERFVFASNYIIRK